MTRTIARIAALALATAAVAAPAASARPDVTPATHAQRAGHAVSSGFVTRPVLDRNPVSPSASPVTVSVAQTDRGIDWLTIGIGVALSLLAVGAIGAIANRSRRAHRPRIAA